MSSVRFRSGDVDLELSGSETFVNRQLLLLSPFLPHVDEGALEPATRLPAPAERDQAPGEAGGAAPGPTPTEAAVHEPAPAPSQDGLVTFYRAHEPDGGDTQAEAALLFAYYLQRREGLGALQIGDLIRCCIRAGVDTRNFNRTLGALTRRGFLETLRHGHAYRLSEQGFASVEQRLS